MRVKADFRPWTAFLILLLAAAGYLAVRPHLLVFDTLEFPIFALLVLGVTVTLALWSGLRHDRRLARLARVAEAMMKGDYTARGDEEGGDSLASLSSSLNQLSERIGTSLNKLKKSEECIRELAYRDSLTGLPNRRMFEDLFAREMKAAERYEYGLALAVLDVDNLKDVNDSLGHAAGDGLLVGVANRLVRQLRSSDVLARLGGDEFALVMRTGGRREHIMPALSRLLNRVREPFDIDSREVRSSLSIGLCFYPEDGHTARDLMSHADFALYQAKNEGRNMVRQFDLSMNELATERIRMEQDLRRALVDGDEFSLWYQPIVTLEDRRLVGMESLVRWQHPQAGLIMPTDFIALAEEAGLLPQLGHRVLVKACRQAARWHEQGHTPIQICVNVSVRQLQAGDFIDTIQRVLTLSDLDPKFLKLEITEDMAAEGQRVLDHLAQLRSVGIQLAIDDFGTGYSSFSYLLKNKIDTIKIDRSFVAGIPDNPDSTAIVRAILSLAQSLDLEVVAEGVENPRQLQFLRDNGCTLGQGFLFQKPAPAGLLEHLLRQGSVPLGHQESPRPRAVDELELTQPTTPGDPEAHATDLDDIFKDLRGTDRLPASGSN